MDKQNQPDLMKAYEVLRLRLSSKFNISWPLEFSVKHGYLRCNAVSVDEETCIYAIDSCHNMHYVYADLYVSNYVNQKSSCLAHEYVITCILDYSKNHDIYLDYWPIASIKLLDAGETLESLAIEYDLTIA